MNKVIFVFAFFFLFINIFASDCTNKKAQTIENKPTNSSSTNTGKDNSNTENKDNNKEENKGNTENQQGGQTTGDDQQGGPTTGDNQQGGPPSGDDQQPSGDNQQPSGDDATTENRLRRILADLTDNDCKDLKTSDDNKYKCVVSSDKSKCEEVSKESSLGFNLSYTILNLLFSLFLL